MYFKKNILGIIFIGLGITIASAINPPTQPCDKNSLERGAPQKDCVISNGNYNITAGQQQTVIRYNQVMIESDVRFTYKGQHLIYIVYDNLILRGNTRITTNTDVTVQIEVQEWHGQIRIPHAAMVRVTATPDSPLHEGQDAELDIGPDVNQLILDEAPPLNVLRIKGNLPNDLAQTFAPYIQGDRRLQTLDLRYIPVETLGIQGVLEFLATLPPRITIVFPGAMNFTQLRIVDYLPLFRNNRVRFGTNQNPADPRVVFPRLIDFAQVPPEYRRQVPLNLNVIEYLLQFDERQIAIIQLPRLNFDGLIPENNTRLNAILNNPRVHLLYPPNFANMNLVDVRVPHNATIANAIVNTNTFTNGVNNSIRSLSKTQ